MASIKGNIQKDFKPAKATKAAAKRLIPIKASDPGITPITCVKAAPTSPQQSNIGTQVIA